MTAVNLALSRRSQYNCVIVGPNENWLLHIDWMEEAILTSYGGMQLGEEFLSS